MEFAAVEELAKNQRDLLFDDPRPVVLHADLEAVVAGRFDRDPDFRDDPRFFASVERVIDRFLDGRQQGLAGVVEAQQVAVLAKNSLTEMSRCLAAIDSAVARGVCRGRDRRADRRFRRLRMPVRLGG